MPASQYTGAVGSFDFVRYRSDGGIRQQRYFFSAMASEVATFGGYQLFRGSSVNAFSTRRVATKYSTVCNRHFYQQNFNPQGAHRIPGTNVVIYKVVHNFQA